MDHAEQLGGAQKSLMELLAHLDRNRFEPMLLCTRGAGWVEREELANEAKHPVFEPSAVFEQRRDDLSASWLQSIGRLTSGMRPVRDLKRALERLQVDVVHTNTLKMHMIGGAAARLAGLPVVWHVRDILEEGPALEWLARAGRWAQPTVIAISRAVADQFAGTDLEPTIIYNGIPLERFTPGAPPDGLRGDIGLRPDDELVCVVGRLTPWKGHRTLLSALRQVAAERPRVKVLVVGEVSFWEADYEAELRTLAEELGVAERVVWLGFRDDVAEILRMCDVFALPSADEPFGRAIIEAMAVAKPVVATCSGGVPEIVLDGETGLLVDPGDDAGLAEALISLLTDRGRAREMGQRGQARAHSQFDVRRVARMVQDVYESVIPARQT